MKDDVLSVYVTASSREEADMIAEKLVSEKLAACVNVLGNMTSVYEWEGKIEHSDEIALIVKTSQTRYAALEKRITEIHSYECPCIVAWKVEKGNDAYLKWVKDSCA